MFYNDDVQLVFWNLKSTQMGRHFSNKYHEKQVLMPYINGPFAFQPLEHFIETVAGWNSTVEHCCTFHPSQSRAQVCLGLVTNNFLQNQLIWINLLHAELKNPKDHFTKTFSTQSTVAGFHWRPILLEALKRAFPPTELEDRIGWKNLLQCNSVTSPLGKISAEL